MVLNEPAARVLVMLTGTRLTIASIILVLLVTVIPAVGQVVYVVHGIDTESDGLDESEFCQDLLLGSFAPGGFTETVFDSTWRLDHPDSYGHPPVFTWYLMTHEAHSQSNQGGNAVPKAMLSRFSDEIEIWGDEIGWHYHHSDWIDDCWQQLLTFDGTVYRQKPDTELAISQLAMVVLENGFFPESFRAGWTWENTDFSNWLEGLILYDYSNRWTNTPPDLNQWSSYHPAEDNYRQVGEMARWISKCRQGGGALNQSDINDAFELAQSQGHAILAFYSHNFSGPTMRSDLEWVEVMLQNAASQYGIPYRYAGAREAMQRSLNISDTLPPMLDVSVLDSVVYLQVNETLYGLPLLAFKGTDGEYHMKFLESDGSDSFSYRFLESEGGYVSAVVAVTDLAGNAAVSWRLAGLSTCTAEAPRCGDINGDNSGPNIIDLTYLISFLSLEGQEPCELASADFNSSGTFDINDLARLISYLFQNGQELNCP